MRLALSLSLAAALALPVTEPVSVTAQSGHLNPVITLHEQGKPVFGITHPQIVAGRGGRGRRGGGAGADAPPPPPPINLADAAKETLAYGRADFMYASSGNDTFREYVQELTKAGGSVRQFPFSAKIGIWHEDQARVTERLVSQLNAGHSIVNMEAVESAQEVRDVIKAMRLTSAGGTRPETGLELAAAYWGLSVDEYKKKADVWPLNPDGELVISVIVESIDGIANVREIAAEPGVSQLFAGYGTLGGVYRDDPGGRDAAVAKILAACKEFDVPCGFPVNNAEEMEQRMAEGWSVFIMQRRDENAMAAIETGRRLSGR